MDPTEAAELLAACCETVDGVNAAYTYEPRLSSAALPIVSVIDDGFNRTGLNSPEVQGAFGDRLIDPFGARLVVWRFNVRLWVSIATDEREAQLSTRLILPRLIRAVEGDTTLPAAGYERAIARGDVGFVDDREGQPMQVTMCDALVAWSEATT